MSSVPLVPLRRATIRSVDISLPRGRPPSSPAGARRRTVHFQSRHTCFSYAYWREVFQCFTSKSHREMRWRSTMHWIADIMSSPKYLIFMALLTLDSLLGDQFRLAALPKACDPHFRIWNTILFFIFVLEIIVMACTVEGYVFHHGGSSSTAAAEHTSNQSSHHGASVRGMRESIVAHASQRWGQIIDWVKHHKPPSFFFWLDLVATVLLLFDPTFNSYVLLVDISSATQTLMTAKVTRVSVKTVRIIRIFRAMSYLRLFNQDESANISRKGLWIMKRRSESMMTPTTSASPRSPSFTSPRASSPSMMEANKPQQQSRLTTTITDNVYRKILMGGIILVVLLPLLSYSAQDTTWDFAFDVLGHVATQGDTWALNNLTSIIAMAAGHVNVLEVEGIRYIDHSSILPSLREEEMITHTSSSTNVILNIKKHSQEWAIEGIVSTLVVIGLFLGLSAFMHADLTRLVFNPLDQMVNLVDRISTNPLAPIPKEELGGSSRHQNQGLEPTLLLQTIAKIGALVKIGLGEAGAGIISRSLQESGNDSSLRLKTSGTLTTSIFVFCDIRNFTDTTECLQEEVMVFVNKIAALLHAITVQCGGAPNKNVGDAFLLVWKIKDHKEDEETLEEEEMTPEQKTRKVLAAGQTKRAGQALYCVLKFALEMTRWQHYVCQFSAGAAQRLFARMPDYKVNIGFGLHVGWAVEGPIGSEQKIDVSYISPNVTLSEFLQDLTKDYGCTVLVSDTFYHLLPPQARYNCRQIDCIRQPDKDPMSIYTFDCDPEMMIEIPGVNSKRYSAFRGSVINIAPSSVPKMRDALPPRSSPLAGGGGGGGGGGARGSSASSSTTTTSTVTAAPNVSAVGNGAAAGSTKESLRSSIPTLPIALKTQVAPLSGQPLSPKPPLSPSSPVPASPKTPKSSRVFTFNNPAASSSSSASSQQAAFQDPLKVTVKPYTDGVWDEDPDLQHIRTKLHPNFRATWNYAMSSYLAGEWSSARKGFETTLEMSQGRDGPSKKLLSVLQNTDYKAPADWPGYRELG